MHFSETDALQIWIDGTDTKNGDVVKSNEKKEQSIILLIILYN